MVMWFFMCTSMRKYFLIPLDQTPNYLKKCYMPFLIKQQTDQLEIINLDIDTRKRLEFLELYNYLNVTCEPLNFIQIIFNNIICDFSCNI